MVYLACGAVDANLSTWGLCFQETIFFNSAIIFGIFIFAFFAIMIWRLRLPGVLALPVGLMVAMALYVSNTGSSTFLSILLIAIVAAFSWVAYAIYKWLRK